MPRLVLYCFSLQLTLLISTHLSAQKFEQCPEIYVHTDRDIYTIGDDVYYKAYLIKDLNDSDVRSAGTYYVDLVAPDSSIVASQKIRIVEGRGNGDFALGVTWASGIYILRVYTEEAILGVCEEYFSKTLEIHGHLPLENVPGAESEAASVEFFPESGYLISGLESTIGIKATDSEGEGIRVSGQIKGADLGSVPFQTDELGFGRVRILPKSIEKITAHIEAQGEVFDVELPVVLAEGYKLELADQTEEKLQIEIACSQGKDLKNARLVGRRNGLVILDHTCPSTTSVTTVELLLRDVGEGLIQLTLYDGQNRPVAEILAFHFGAMLNTFLDLNVDSDVVDPHGAIVVELESYDQEGEPIAANLSLSITDKDYLHHIRSDIRTHTLRDSEVRGHIRYPHLYFDDEPEVCMHRMQNLLLTQGWRKYSWLETAPIETTAAPPTSGLTLRGRVTMPDNAEKGLLASGFLSELTNSLDLFPFTTDADGYFTISGLEIDGTRNLLIQAARARKSNGEADGDQIKLKGNRNVDIQVFPNPTLSITDLDFRRPISESPIDFIHDNATRVNASTEEWEGLSVTTETVVVNESRLNPVIENYRDAMFYHEPNQRLMLDDIPARGRFQSVIEIILARVPSAQLSSVKVTGDGVYGAPGGVGAGAEKETRIKFRALSGLSSSTINTGYATYMLNGMTVSPATLQNIPPEEIAFVDIITDLSQLAAYGVVGSGGIVAVYLNPPGHRTHVLEEKKGSLHLSYEGYYQAREFYVPKYEGGAQVDQDDRVTLLWEPNISLQDGEAVLETFASTRKGEFVLIASGVSSSGIPLFATKTVSVK